MSKRIFLTATAIALAGLASGCDVCGIFLGITPQDRVSSFGLFHRYRLLQRDFATMPLAKHGDMHEEEAMRYRESYSTLELRADVWFMKRLSLLVVVPVVNNTQTIDGTESAYASGLGDPYLLVRYALLQPGSVTATEGTLHRLLLGGGVKLPLGHAHRTYNNAEVDHDLQPGSGSWDLLGSLEHQARLGRWASAFQVIGRYNGENHVGMRSGHGLTTSLDVGYAIERGVLQVRPFAGAYHELMTLDQHHGESIDGTGCSTLFVQGGMRIWWKSLALAVTAQVPVARNDGDFMLSNQFRSVVGLSWMLLADKDQR